MSDTTYALGDSVLTKYPEVPLPRDRGVPVTEGIIVGKRSLRNGHMRWDPMYDLHWLPDPTSFTVYLEVYSLTRVRPSCASLIN